MTAAKGSSRPAASKGQPARTGKSPVAKAARVTPAKSAAKASSKGPAKPAPAKAPVRAALAKAAAKPAASRGVTANAHPAGPVSTRPATTKPLPVKAAAKPAVGKSTTIKTPGRKGRGEGGSEANLHKRVDSERIAQHIAAFEKSGGRVEKLGVTRVLQKVSEVAAAAPAQAAKTGSRKR